MKVLEKVIQSNLPPQRQDVVWIDTSDAQNPVVKLYVNGEWQLASSESADVQRLQNEIDQIIEELTGEGGTIQDLANVKQGAEDGTEALGKASELEEKVGSGSIYDISILDPGEDQYAYGVLIDFTDGKHSYDLTRIGNMDLHRELPVQSQYKGCIWDINTQSIVTYLNPQDWSLATDDKTAEEIDELLYDATKSIRVETPKFYACSKVLATDGAGNTTMAKVMFSTQKLNPWYVEVPKMVTDFRDVRITDNEDIVSTLNNGDTIYGGYCNTKNRFDTASAGLLHPITNIDRDTFRQECHNSNTYPFSYEAYKWIFYWAVVIEYATLFTAKPMIQELDSNGFHQGGLGPGMTSIESYGAKYSDDSYIYNEDYDIQDCFYLGANYFQSDSSDEFPLRDIGVTNNWGNRTGENIVAYTRNNKTSHVHQNRYRGFEFPFGDIMMNLDGVLCANRNGIDYYLTCKNPDRFADDITDTLWYDNAASEDWRIAGTIKKEFNPDDSHYQYPISFGGYDESGQMMYANIGNEGDLIPQATIQPSDGQPRNFVNQFYPIDNDNNVDSPDTLLVGSYAGDYDVHAVGLGYFTAADGVGDAHSSLGFRCFNIIQD